MTEEEWADLAKQLIDASKDGGPSVTDWISAIATALTFLIALVAAFFAKGQLDEASTARKQTKALEREKSQPYVVAYLEVNGASSHVLDLVVKNFGQTAGRNVRLSFSPALNRTKSDGGTEDVTLPEVISFLAPGQEWRTIFDAMNERSHRTDMPLTYDGVVTYEGLDGEAQKSDAVIDLHPYKARRYAEVHGTHHVAQALRGIRDNQKKWSELHGGLKVYSRDGDAKDERKHRQFEEWQNQQETASSGEVAES